jgi:hypothetical protein
MTSALQDWGRVEVHPGRGVVHRGADNLLIVPEVGEGQDAAARQLLELCGHGPEASDTTGRRRLRQVARLLTELDPDDVPGFALLVESGDRFTLLVHGAVTATLTGSRDEVVSAAESLAWVERAVPSDFTSLSVVAASRVGGADASAGQSPRSDHGQTAASLVLDLVLGSVPGSGATLRHSVVGQGGTTGHAAARVLDRPAYPRPAEPAAPAAATARDPVPAATDHPVQSVPEQSDGRTVLRQTVQVRRVRLSGPDRSRPAVRRAPLPLATDHRAAPAEPGDGVVLEGVLCPADHLNEPGARTCGTCGASVAADAPRVSGPRPPLGVLVTDEGSVYTVGTDYVVGRDPTHAPDVVAGRALPLVLRDAEHSTSRVHARLHLSGWEVLVTDCGSSNGTYVSRTGARGPWDQVYREPGTRLRPGDRVRLGKRQILFDRYQHGTPVQPIQPDEEARGPRR